MEKIVMITGVSGGLGQIAGRMMMENGWQVAQVTRDAGRIDSTQEDIGEIIEADVSTPSGSKAAIDLIQQHLGELPSALLNCAGSVLIAPMHRTNADQYRECLQANLDSAFFSLSAFVAALIKKNNPVQQFWLARSPRALVWPTTKPLPRQKEPSKHWRARVQLLMQARVYALTLSPPD